MIKRNKASKSEFKEVWPGLNKCLDCGFTLATVDGKEKDEDGKLLYPKENTLHSTYHGKYFRMREQFGYSNVLTYKELLEKSENMNEILSTIKDNDVLQDENIIRETYLNIKDFSNRVLNWVDEQRTIGENTMITQYHRDIFNFNLKFNVHIENINEYSMFLASVNNEYKNIFEKIHSISGNNSNSVLVPIEDFNLPYDKKNEMQLISMIDGVLQLIPTKLSRIEMALHDFFSVEFTKSMRVWDMCKVHPKFDDYVTLLWNTPKFRCFIKKYMTESQYQYYINKNLANRYLIDSYIKEAPYFFGSVDKTNVIVSNCNLDVIDLSYMDNMLIDDEDDEIVDISADKGYQETVKFLETVGKNLISKK